MAVDVQGQEIQQEALKEVARRLAEGKGVLLTERRNEQEEKLLTEEMTERARAGEHFPSSLHME